ncbi:hypothetical protein AB0D08_27420 [Kitasatospora sp. NPDC048540]|uniref:hypothetical protein n=1 Tax=Kitasatospora sp. NPDC048540 TaxID=3155634 RepID=UPI0033C7D840
MSTPWNAMLRRTGRRAALVSGSPSARTTPITLRCATTASRSAGPGTGGALHRRAGGKCAVSIP